MIASLRAVMQRRTRIALQPPHVFTVNMATHNTSVRKEEEPRFR
jgi:hypothetical protein